MNDNKTLVSIICLTYNHERYIRDALAGFLMQKTAFQYEIIVHDDASTDDTQNIIKEFALKHPGLIMPIYQDKNQYSLGREVFSDHIRPLIKGKYVALCDGDDYWISSDKLQKQVDLLENNSQAVMSVALTHIYKQDGLRNQYLETTSSRKDEVIEYEDLRRSYYHTSTYLIRSSAFLDAHAKYFAGHTMFGDTALRYILLSYGTFVVLAEPVSVYRVTGEGVWTSLDRYNQLVWEYNVTAKLSKILPVHEGRKQEDRLYAISKELLRKSLRSLQIGSSIRWGITNFSLGAKRKYIESCKTLATVPRKKKI